MAANETNEPFPEVDAQAELNPGENKNVDVDPSAPEIGSSKDKGQEETGKKKKETTKKDGAQTLKSFIIMSALIAAVAGAAFAITKKLKEK